MAAWLGDFIELNDHGGDWHDYLDAIYGRFCADFVNRKAAFLGRPVSVRKHPPSDGKEYGFWHCISTGKVEAHRIPDFERCKRIGWIRAIIDNANQPEVEGWTEVNGSEIEHILWLNEEFFIVLSERGCAADGGPECYLLTTAYTTFREHEKRKKRTKRNAARKANAALQWKAASNTPSTHGG